MTWAVSLDFHNTLVHCDAWFNLEVYDLIPAFLEWRRSTLGIRADPDQIDAGKQHYLKLRRRVIDTGIELDAASAVAEVVTYLGLTVEAAEIARALDDIFRPTVTETASLPGAVESVWQLHAAGVRLVVVSSAAYHPFLEWTLDKLGIAGCFEVILTSASTGHYKSSTRIYEAAAAMLDIKPGNCIHIGDSERFDVLPANAVGMRTVLVGNESGRSIADVRLPTLDGLPQVLQREFGLPLAL